MEVGDFTKQCMINTLIPLKHFLIGKNILNTINKVHFLMTHIQYFYRIKTFFSILRALKQRIVSFVISEMCS